MKQVVLVLLLASCARSLPPQRFAAVDDVQPGDESNALGAAAVAIDPLLRGYTEQVHARALAVGVIYRDQLVWSGLYGPQTPTLDTVFAISSLTKLFTGLAVLKLRDQGRLSLDDPAERWLPELGGVVYPTTDSPRITLRHLLTHTSGLPFNPSIIGDEITERALLQSLRDQKLAVVPGSTHSYSHMGGSLLGPVLQRVAGRDFRTVITSEILEPMGLKSATWDRRTVPAGLRSPSQSPLDKMGANAADAGLYLSLRDLARFASFALDAWPPRSGPDRGVVRRATVREWQLPSVTRGFGMDWALDWDTQLGDVVDAVGAIYDQNAFILLVPGRGLGVVMLGVAESQLNNHHAVLKTLAVQTLRLLLPQPTGAQ